jgi:hypothetical protein
MFFAITPVESSLTTAPRVRGPALVACARGIRAVLATVLPGLLLAIPVADAIAGEFVIATNPPVGQSTCTTVQIRGFANESFAVGWTDSKGVAQTTTSTTASPSGGTQGFAQTCVDAGKKTTITVKNKTQRNEPVQEERSLALLDPPSSRVVTVLATNPTGSVVSIGGNLFTLGGGYTTVTTQVDYDRQSPTFGLLGGVVSASDFNITGSGAAGEFSIALGADAPWSINVGALWGIADFPSTGFSVPFSVALAGTLNFNSLLSPVVGSLTGTVTFLDNNLEVISGNLGLQSNFGFITGTYSSSGQSILVPEPPALLLVFAAGIALLWTTMLRRRRLWKPIDGPGLLR